MNIGERIYERRKELKVPVKDIAAACAVTISAVYQWEAGDTKTLKAANIVAVAELLKTHEKWLLTGHGPKNRGNAIPLEPDEYELIRDYRECAHDIQDMLRAMAKMQRKKNGR